MGFSPAQQIKNKKVQACDLKNVTVLYDTYTALENVSFTIPCGVLAAVVGPNGAGKSTLIKTMLGFVSTHAGTIQLCGTNSVSARKEIAYVPQTTMVDWDFPATVYDVVMMGRYRHVGWLSRPQMHDHELVRNALEQVGMAAYHKRPISQLSGGQKQRVFLARALVQEAELYVLDEPFVGIDAPTEQVIVNLLRMLRDKGKTVIVVHHDLYTVRTYFDWIVLLNKSVITYGSVDRVFSHAMIERTYGASAMNMIKKKKDNHVVN